MNVEEYLAPYPEEIKKLYDRLRQLIFESTSCELEEKLWARLPSYYVGEAFVRLIPFKDHINIEAEAAARYAESLSGCKRTPKGMIQLCLNDPIPAAVLKQIFSETLNGSKTQKPD